MKKFILYFLLTLLIAALAILAYGFWNAKNIRKWAQAAAETKSRHDIVSQEEDIAQRMNASGGKKVAEFGVELSGFSADLEAVAKELNAAKSDIGAISVPREGKSVRIELDDYYQKSENQIQDMANIAKYLTMVFNVTSIFDRMNPDATAEEIRDMIAEAKEKGKAVETEVLPVAMRSSGNDLKVSVDNYLDQFDQYANGKIENHDQLNESYARFSEKLNDFLVSKKNYFDTFEDIDLSGKKIDEHLMILEKVKFSIK